MPYFFQKLRYMSQNVSSAAVMYDILRVNSFIFESELCLIRHHLLTLNAVFYSLSFLF